MIKRFLMVAVLLSWSFAMEVEAGATASQWVIVVNGQSARSRTIANHYTHWRNIPSLNVISLDEVPSGLVVSMVDFKEKILRPLFKEIERRKLTSHIQGIAYSSDFPVAVDLALEQKPAGPQAQFVTPVGSLTGLTYLYRLVFTEGSYFLALGNNFYAQRPAVALLGPTTGDPENEVEKKIRTFRDEKDYFRLADLLDEQLKLNPHQYPIAYAAAQAWAMAGESAKALQRLQHAIEAGWSFSKYAQEDPQLEKLREYSRFQTLIRGCEDEPFDWTPPQAFDARKFYYPNGVGGFVATNGVSYLLSFSLAVCMDRGNTVEEALRQLKTSIDADFTHPKGTFYFTKTDDPRTKCRESGFSIACDRLKSLGFDAEIITDPLPLSKTCMGVTMGVSDFEWGSTKSKLLPGALGDNLTSWGAVMDSINQTKLTEFLRHGAAASSGTVTEPFAIQAKFPHPTLHSTYASGLTAAEAYYASLAGPYQLLIAGDPLCQPFAKPPRFVVTGLKEGDSIRDRVEIDFAQSDDPDSSKPRAVALLMDGEFRGLSRFPTRLKVAGRDLIDGAHEFRFIATDESRLEARWEKSIWVTSGPTNRQLRFTGPKSWKAADRKPLVVNILATDPQNIVEIRNNMATILTVEGAKNTCEVPVDKLGTGPVRLQAFERTGNGYIASLPIVVAIE